MSKKSATIYENATHLIKFLTDEDAGKIVKAIIAHSEGDDVELDGTLLSLFTMIRSEIDEEDEAKAERSRRNKKNIKKRWEDDTKSESRMENDTKDESRIENDTKKESGTENDTKAQSGIEMDTKLQSGIKNDTKHESRMEIDTKTESRINPPVYYSDTLTHRKVDGDINNIKNNKYIYTPSTDRIDIPFSVRDNQSGGLDKPYSERDNQSEGLDIPYSERGDPKNKIISLTPLLHQTERLGKCIGEIYRPRLEAVEKYIAEHKYRVDAKEFWEYYEEQGWMIDGEPMRSWQAVVRGWARRGKRLMHFSNERKDIDYREIERQLWLKSIRGRRIGSAAV